MSEGVYKFVASYGRMGTLSGVFISDQPTIDSIIGKTISFGDALGKHSDVRIEIEPKMIRLLTDDSDFVSKFKEFGLATGTNPLVYYEEFEE